MEGRHRMQPIERADSTGRRMAAGPPLAHGAVLLLRAAALVIIASPVAIAVALLVG